MAKVLVPVADGSEEIETSCITDTLTRCGCQVTVASVVPGQLQVKMSRGLKVVADCAIEDCKGQDWDAIALPGGMPGAETLRDSAVLIELLKEQSTKGKIFAAVCASPAVVFGSHGLLPEKATCYPNPKFKEIVGAAWQDGKAIVDGQVVTSQGPGTSIHFALTIAEKLCGKEKVEEVAKAMLVDYA
mmetsp:Transcript_131846/g.186017  ORF Transcript_131846/g.186017 Transcript_131846/m.186017 type:complete len:187 (+) Transcript_131846:50-610(+)